MRADDTARLERQAGQMHPAVAGRDARGEESFAAEIADDLLPAVEPEDLHGTPSVWVVRSLPTIRRRAAAPARHWGPGSSEWQGRNDDGQRAPASSKTRRSGPKRHFHRLRTNPSGGGKVKVTPARQFYPGQHVFVGVKLRAVVVG